MAAVEQAERAFYERYVRPGMTLFDVGANVGALTLLFARLVAPSGRVHAFEPGRDNFERLQRAVAPLRGRVHSCRLALADQLGEAQLYVYDSQHSTWNTLARRPLREYGVPLDPLGTEAVRTMTLDAYCQEHAIRRIDLLKIDVEGAEYQVLRGAEALLRNRCIHCCVFEFGQTTFDMGNRPEAIERLLDDCGYELRNLIPGQPVFPGRESAALARYSMHVAKPAGPEGAA